MDNTLLSAIIGGVIASGPAVITTVLNFVDSALKRKHEAKVRKSETIDKAKTDALREFSRALGKCLLIDEQNADTVQSAESARGYVEAYENLFLYVSEETQNAMLQLGDPYELSWADREVIKVNRCLAAEMRSLTEDRPRQRKRRKPVDRDDRSCKH